MTQTFDSSVTQHGDAQAMPGSEAEHLLQERYGTVDRARAFYRKQVLDHLAPAMKDFVDRTEFLFVATSDRHGECDCTSKFGEPGFIRILSEKHIIYPEYRGNGVYANTGNMQENPHIGLLMIDFYRDAIGLHVNGRARVIENDALLAYGARYVCEKVMVLYAGRGAKQRQVEIVGKIGAHTLYTGHIDLGTDRIEDEEQTFTKAVAALLDA